MSEIKITTPQTIINNTPFKVSSHQQLVGKAQKIIENELATPRSRTSVFQLPCGVVTETEDLVREVQIRQMDGEVEDMLASTFLTLSTKMSQLLTMCVTRIGPYTEREVINQLPDELTVGDRVFLIYAIRRASVGDTFPLIDRCPNINKEVPTLSCGKEDLHRFDLATLEVKLMPDPLKREFDEELPSGGRAKWHVMVGRDEARLAHPSVQAEMKSLGLSEDRMRATRILLSRVTEVSGEPVTILGLQKLGMEDRNFLRDRFDEVEGGIYTNFDTECKYCKTPWTVGVDVTSTGFFSPSKVLRAWKQKSST